MKAKDFDARKNTWCPGCGDAGVLAVLKRLCAEMEISPADLVNVSGIGCSSKISEYHLCCGFHWLHGRTHPLAMGVKLVNPNLIVLTSGGDGDHYAIGMEHFLHAARLNPDITDIVMNNQVYALTKGQLSPTGHQGLVTTTSPKGANVRPVDPVLTALAAGAGFIARGYSFAPKQLQDLIRQAIAYRGYALLDILSPCPTYHREPDYDQIRDWYQDNILDIVEAVQEMRRSIVDITEVEPGYDPTDRAGAFSAVLRAQEEVGKIPVGLIYRGSEFPTYEDTEGARRGNAVAELELSPSHWQAQFEQLKNSFY